MAVTPVLSHPWTLPLAQARALQQRLTSAVIDEDRLPEPVRAAHLTANRARSGPKTHQSVERPS